MKIHVLVEGPSEKAFVEPWARRAFKGHVFEAHPHQGKGSLPKDPRAAPNPRRRGLLDMLPATLRAYGQSLDPKLEGVVVLVDADADDCGELKRSLLDLATKIGPCPPVVFRIAVEETEAFYLGDLKALRAAFPKADMAIARGYKPDSICETAELFGRVVDDGGLNKVAWAEAIAPHLTTKPAQSRSPSFRALHGGIARLVAATAKEAKPKRRRKHWRARTNQWRKQS